MSGKYSTSKALGAYIQNLSSDTPPILNISQFRPATKAFHSPFGLDVQVSSIALSPSFFICVDIGNLSVLPVGREILLGALILSQLWS